MKNLKIQPDKDKDKTVISEEWTGKEDKPIYLCSFCNCVLSKLQDMGHNNYTWWGSRCSTSWDPDIMRYRQRGS